MAGSKTRYGRRNPNRPAKSARTEKAAPPPAAPAAQQALPSHIDPRVARLGSGDLNADVALMQEIIGEQNFPIMAPDAGLTALTHEARIELIASLDLEPTLTAVAELCSAFDIAMTTDWQTQRIEGQFIDSIDETWGTKLAQRIAKGDVLIVPRAVAQLVREIMESANITSSAARPTSGQIAELLISLNSEQNTNEYSEDGTLSGDAIAQMQTEMFSMNTEQTLAWLRDHMTGEVASVLADAPLKLEIAQGNFVATWQRPWPDRVTDPTLGKTPSDTFATANKVELADLQILGQFLLDGIKTQKLRYTRAELEMSGATPTAISYCLNEMSRPIKQYRKDLARDRRQGSVQQQRFTFTRFPFLRAESGDEIIALRYQWVLDRFFGQMLYWPTFAGLPGFRFGKDPEPGSPAESFSAGINDVFERTVGDSLTNITRDSRSGTEVITECELQAKWSTGRGETPSACDWVVKAGRACLVVDATNHHLDATLAQGLGNADTYALDMETTFGNPGEKFDQLAKTIRRLHESGSDDFGLPEDVVFVPLVVVPDGGVPNIDSTDLDLQLRSQPHLKEFDGHILAPAVLTLTQLQLIEGISEHFGHHPLLPDGIMALASWRTICTGTSWPTPFDQYIDSIVPARPIPTRILNNASELVASLRNRGSTTPDHAG